MISPSEDIKFAIPLVEPLVCRDSVGNFVPHVVRDDYDRIVRAAGKIEGGVLPPGSVLSELLSETVTKEKVRIHQIIPVVWGGSGAHVDNVMYPTLKQHTNKAQGPTELEVEIAEHLKFKENSVIFFYNFKYDGESLFPSKAKRYIDVVHANGYRDCYRNGAQYEMITENLSRRYSITSV
uniref:COesterase domain-containing protein n=1 Tax=Panagrellus redivivus TaxID=6233 RepID=A0A7E4UYC2_PANRE